MTVDRKMVKEEILFLIGMLVVIGLVCFVVWSAHG